MQERRQKLKVKNRFQHRFLLEMVLAGFIVINFLLAAVVYLGQDFSPREFSLTLGLVLGAAEFTGLGLLYWYLLHSSHRIAGPIHSLENSLRELGQGDLTVSLHFRNRDHWHDTGEVFNESVQGLRERVLEIQCTAQAIKAAQSPDSPAAAQVDVLLQQLQTIRTGPGSTDAV